MVFVWGWGGGPRRRRGFGGPRGGYGPGYGPGRGYGPGYGRGYGPGYGGGYGGGGYDPRYRRNDGGCLRDLLLLNTGCCLAEALGCGLNLALVAPSTVRSIGPAAHPAHPGRPRRPVDRMVAAIRVYQREISPRRPPVCRFTPSCSAYAVDALTEHGAWRGSWLTLGRLLRCRPGATGGPDPVPGRG